MKAFVKYIELPSSGNESEDSGSVAKIRAEKIVKERKMVTHKLIFSSALGGSQKTTVVMRLSTIMGVTILTMQ